MMVHVFLISICILYSPSLLFSSTDESLSSYNLLTAHSSHQVHHHHHHQQQHQQQNQQQQQQLHHQQVPQIQLQTTSISSSASIPHMSSNYAAAGGSSSLVQSLSSQPLEPMAYNEEFLPTAGIDEQYIYVTYPTELKKRLTDRYDKDAFLFMERGQF